MSGKASDGPAWVPAMPVQLLAHHARITSQRLKPGARGPYGTSSWVRAFTVSAQSSVEMPEQAPIGAPYRTGLID